MAQNKRSKDHDYLLPKKGKSMFGLNSGIPYIGIAEYSYGISNRFSAGIIYGYTPVLLGFGLRLKAVIAQPNESVRFYLKSPLIYYPKTIALGGEPWLLAWPTLSVEWKLKNGARVWTGLGIVGAACADFIFGGEESDKEASRNNGSETFNEKEMEMADLWNTFQFGYSKPLSNKFSFMLEIAPVMRGLKLSPTVEWIGGPPVIVTFGLSYSL